jgi:hypothetical protein
MPAVIPDDEARAAILNVPWGHEAALRMIGHDSDLGV